MMCLKKLAVATCLCLFACTAPGWAAPDPAAKGTPVRQPPAPSGVESDSQPPAPAGVQSGPQQAAPDGVESVQDQTSRAPNGKVSLALTLAGGGARGVAHIGVLKVLEREGIRPDFIAGSSMGAFIGCLYAAGMTPEEIERLALDGSMKKAFFPIPLQLKSAMYIPKYIFLRLLTFHPDIGIFSGKSLARFMEKTLPPGIRNLEQTKIPIAVTATNLIDTRSVWFTTGNIGEAVRASCSVPMLYRPVKKTNGNGNGKLVLVDGGIRENLPTDVAKAAGAPLVLAVKLHSYLDKVPETEFDTNSSYVDRITSIFMSEIESNAVARADILIEPKVSYMQLHSFDKNLKQVIDAGEKAAMESLPKLKKLLGKQAAATAPSSTQ